MSRRMRNVFVSVSLLAGLALIAHSYRPIVDVSQVKFQSPIVLHGPKSTPAATITHTTTPSHEGLIPQRIWQTWRDAPMGLADDYKGWTSTWISQNPTYRYELLTDNTAFNFVQTMFADRPDIIDTFRRTEDIILRADYLRYLALLAEGGTYADMDTECSKPIDDWIPKEYLNSTGFVVGVEYDAMDDGIRSDFEDRVQLCQWGFMSAKGNKVLLNIVNRVTKALQALAPDGGRIIVGSNDDVLHVTGPRIFSYAILEELSRQQKRNITVDDITKLTGPKQFGDTLILTVNAFGSGQAHSQAKEQGNSDQLLWHHFNGFWGWKDAHDGAREREKEAKEKEAKEKESAAEKETKEKEAVAEQERKEKEGAAARKEAQEKEDAARKALLEKVEEPTHGEKKEY